MFAADIVEMARMAALAHDGQRRKSGAPYIVHPFGVTGRIIRIRNWPLGADRDVCILSGTGHDILEDSKLYKYKDIADRFGDKVASVIQELTQDRSIPWAERREKMIARCGEISLEARIVKLADRLDNMEDLKGVDNEFKARYAKEAKAMAFNMRGTCPELEQQLQESIKKALVDLPVSIRVLVRAMTGKSLLEETEHSAGSLMEAKRLLAKKFEAGFNIAVLDYGKHCPPEVITPENLNDL